MMGGLGDDELQQMKLQPNSIQNTSSMLLDNLSNSIAINPSTLTTTNLLSVPSLLSTPSLLETNTLGTSSLLETNTLGLSSQIVDVPQAPITYTIRQGTILYHGTKQRGFDTNLINLGNDKLVKFFTPDLRLASDVIQGCSLNKLDNYIHIFRVKKDIPNIYVKMPYDIADDIDSGVLANEFCCEKNNYSGLGFFYPKNNIEMFSNNQIIFEQERLLDLSNESNYYSEFAICNPKIYLEYVESLRCMSLRKLSKPYRIDE